MEFPGHRKQNDWSISTQGVDALACHVLDGRRHPVVDVALRAVFGEDLVHSVRQRRILAVARLYYDVGAFHPKTPERLRGQRQQADRSAHALLHPTPVAGRPL